MAKKLDDSAKRHIDRVARYGGEEFVVILPETDLAGAEVLAERICTSIYDLNIEHNGADKEKRLTVSIGVSTTIPRFELDPLQAVEIADAKLYEAKASGRNCWRSAENRVVSEEA